MRIYLPATTADLADEVGLSARRAHARTPALAAAHSDVEEGEFRALLTAATDSLELVRRSLADGAAADSSDASRRGTLCRLRVVVAADVDDAGRAGEGEPLSAVRAPAVPWSKVVSFHLDDLDDEHARELLRRAVEGDADATAAVDELALLWYDVTEREHVLQQL